ncbi:MAG: hypothetical protein JW940_31965 [Polyangiaceae bacterium]|nr:hypothetical protein [Polyangiaceae bacterium]
MTRRRSPWSTAALTALITLSLVRAAGADAYDAALTRAVAAKERALDTRAPTDWEQALDLFQQAEIIRSTPETCYEVGFAAEMLRQDDLALDAYEVALAGKLTESARRRARAFVDRHAREMGRVELEGPDRTVVRVRGLYRGTLPLARPLVMFVGSVELELQAPGGRQWVHTLVVSAGATSFVDLGAAPEPPPPTEPGPAGPAPTEPTEPAASPGAAAAPEAPARAAASEPPSRVLELTLFGAGTAVAIGSVVLVVMAPAAIDSHLDTLRPICADLDGDQCMTAADQKSVVAAQDENDAIKTWKNVRTAAFVGLGVGGAAMITGAVLLLASPPADRQATGSVFVRPTSGGSVVGYSGAF